MWCEEWRLTGRLAGPVAGRLRARSPGRRPALVAAGRLAEALRRLPRLRATTGGCTGVAPDQQDGHKHAAVLGLQQMAPFRVSQWLLSMMWHAAMCRRSESAEGLCPGMDRAEGCRWEGPLYLAGCLAASGCDWTAALLRPSVVSFRSVLLGALGNGNWKAHGSGPADAWPA